MKTVAAFLSGGLWMAIFAVPPSVTSGWALNSGIAPATFSMCMIAGVIVATLYAVIGD